MPLKLFSLLVVFIVLQSLNPSSKNVKDAESWPLSGLFPWKDKFLWSLFK